MKAHADSGEKHLQPAISYEDLPEYKDSSEFPAISPYERYVVDTFNPMRYYLIRLLSNNNGSYVIMSQKHFPGYDNPLGRRSQINIADDDLEKVIYGLDKIIEEHV
jgi:hypothetical protein